MKRLLLALALLAAAPLFAEGPYYVSCPSVGPDGLSSGTSVDPKTLWTIMGIGSHPDVVINVLGTNYQTDGHYTGTSCMFDPPAGLDGTAGHPIVVNMVNMPAVGVVGGVLFDGGNTQGAVMNMDGHSYWNINGFMACCHGPLSGGGPVRAGNGAVGINMTYFVAADALINYNNVGISSQNSPLLLPGPQINLGPNTFRIFGVIGKSRKGLVDYAHGPTPGNGSTYSLGIVIDAGSTNVGPKGDQSVAYHAKNPNVHDMFYIFTGSAIPSTYSLQNNGAWYADSVSATPTTIGTGTKTFTVTGTNTCPVTGGTNPLIQMIHRGDATGNTFMRGNVLSCTGGVLTLNVTTTGGAGTFSDWDQNRYYTGQTAEELQGLVWNDQTMTATTGCPSGSGGNCNYDITSDINGSFVGNIGLVRNADSIGVTSCFVFSQMSAFKVANNLCAIDTNWASTTHGFSLLNCTNTSQITCQGVSGSRLLTSSNNWVIGGNTSNLVQGDWGGGGVTRLATNATFSYTTAGLCYQYDDLGNQTAIQRWPHPMSASIQSLMTYLGYTPIDVQAALVSVAGAIPAACDSTQTTPTPTITGTRTSTPSPTSTSTPTPTFTPTATATKTATPAAGNCTATHVERLPGGKIIRWTHTAPCMPGTTIAIPHQHASSNPYLKSP